MSKKSKKNPGALKTKRGAPDHFQGKKRQFLDSQANLYQQALDGSRPKENVKEFYDKITRDFVEKFGDSEPFALEPPDDPPDVSGDLPVPADLTEEEAEKATERWMKLRTVNNSCALT